MEVSTTTNILNAGFSRNTTASDLLNTDTFGIGNALRITPINDSRNTALNSTIEQENNPNLPVNAFGIGSANQPEVELSPQARILQQNDANQRALAEGLQEIRDNAREEREAREERAAARENNTLQTPEPSQTLASNNTTETPSAPRTVALESSASLETSAVSTSSVASSATSSASATISVQAQRATSLYTSVQNFT